MHIIGNVNFIMTTITRKGPATTELERMETETSATGENLEFDMKDTRTTELKTKGTHIAELNLTDELQMKGTLTEELKTTDTQTTELKTRGTRITELKTIFTRTEKLNTENTLNKELTTTDMQTTELKTKGTRIEKLNTENTLTTELTTRGIRTIELKMKDTRITDDNEAEVSNILPLIMGRPSSAGTSASKRTRSTISVDCDVCRATRDMTSVIYCRLCKQKLCTVCMVIHNRLGGTRQHYEYTETCVSTNLNVVIIDSTTLKVGHMRPCG